jgi:SAM-dependent methyltransferase
MSKTVGNADLDIAMFDVRVFNPISLEMETVLSLPPMSEMEAVRRAEAFLFSRGVKFGDVLMEGADRAQNIYCFEDEDSAATSMGGFHFSASPSIYHVFKHIRQSLSHDITSFADLGCGPGNILLGAHWLLGASTLTGVEIDPGLATRARANTEGLNANIIVADLLTWVPEENDFEMVYIYEPLRGPELLNQFHDNLRTWLRDGQYVFYQRAYAEAPEWLTLVDLPPYSYPCLYKFSSDSKAQ